MNELQQQILASSGYKAWKHRQQREYFLWFAGITAVLTAVFFLLRSIGFSGFAKKDLIFGLCVLGLFAVMALLNLVQLVRSFRWRPDRCWKGTVTGMHQERLPNRRVKASWVTATVSPGKELDGLCLSETYHNLAPGDQVYLFTLGNKRIYCIALHQ